MSLLEPIYPTQELLTPVHVAKLPPGQVLRP
jgi:hypothetical protein